MIKRLTNAGEISILFKLEDKVEKQIPCDHATWIQWLTEQANNSKLGIWANIKDDKVTAYLVMINSVLPPISDTVSVLYLWAIDYKSTKEIVEKAKKWVISTGAKKAIITVGEDHTKKYMSKFGGVKMASVYEWRVD